MRAWTGWLVAMALAVGWANAGDTDVARVGDVPVTAAEFAEALGAAHPDGDVTEDDRAEALQKLVEEKALYLDAVKKGYDRSPKIQKMLANTVLKDDVYAGIDDSTFTDDVLRAYYDTHTSDFSVPATVRVSQVLVKTGSERTEAQAKKIAETVLKQAKAHPDQFATLAGEYSDDASKAKGGDVGFIGEAGKVGVPADVAAKAMSAAVGDIVGPVVSTDGVHVLLVSARREMTQKDFETVKPVVLKRAKQEKMQAAYDAYLKTAMAGLSVSKNAAMVASTTPVLPPKPPAKPAAAKAAPAAPAAKATPAKPAAKGKKK